MSTSSKDRTMRVVVDSSACCGYGICAEICPEVYKLDPAGIAYVETEIVHSDLIARAEEGAEACPQAALKLEPVDG